MSASQPKKTAKPKKPRAAKAKPFVPNVIEPKRVREAVKPTSMRESNRDAALIPARIKQRMADLIAILGHRELFALFDPKCEAALMRMEHGLVPPTWEAWRAFQIVERTAFRAVRRMRSNLRKPRLLAVGESVRVTPMTPAELAALYEAEERERPCRHTHCGCQHVPEVLPENVVRLRRRA